MALLPFLFGDSNLWAPPRRSHRNCRWADRSEPTVVIPRDLLELPEYFRNLDAALKDTGATVNYDKDKFHANFDVQHFKPEEICVKLSEDNRTVTIEGKHEEKEDEHGQIYRHFVRKYTLPKDCDFKKLESKLSSDGVLSITAPRIVEHKQIEDHRSIPIIRTGQPAKSIEKKSGSMED